MANVLPNEHSLEQRCKDAIQFFKKTSVTIHQKKECLYHLPAYLVVGPAKSGKTSFIAKSDVKFILEKKNKNSNSSQSCYDFWVSQEAVWIDTPGEDFWIPDEKAVGDRLQDFIKILKQQRYLSHLKGVVVVLNLLDIVHPKEGFTADVLQKRLQSILAQLKNPHLPIFIVLNQCDLLPGFIEFFDDLSREERFQPFGLPLPQEEKGVQAFQTAFHLMLYRLNNQLMWYLLHEKRLDRRFLMHQWAAQMTALCDELKEFFKPILESSSFCLAGMFFTSATQSIPNDSSALSPEEASLSSCQALMVIRAPTARSFFTHDLMDVIIPQSRLAGQRLSKYWSWVFRTMMLLMVISVLGLSGTFLFKALKNQLDLINRAQSTLGEYKSYALLENNHRSIVQQLQRLEILRATRALLENTADHYSFGAVTHKILFKLNDKVDTTYVHALQAILLPLMKEPLVKLLSDPSSSPDQLYSALRSYLMLHDLTQMNGDDLVSVMQSIWANQYQPDIQARLVFYLRELLSYRFTEMAIDDALVKKARDQLNHQDPLLLASIILKNAIPSNIELSLNLSTNKTAAGILSLADDKTHILSMYTTANFQTIDPKLIQKSAQEALDGNWVLGFMTQPNSSISSEELTQQLTDTYLKNYADAWVNFLGNIQLAHFNRLDQMNDVLQLLTSDHSPLTQLVRLVQTNVADAVAQHNRVLNAWKNLSVSPMLVQPLGDLSQIISSIVSDTHPEQKAFDIASLRMRSDGQGSDAIENIFVQSQHAPEPLKRWMNTLATNAWQLILSQAQSYANTQWKQTILPSYQAQLQNRFPLNPMASEDISLENFGYFFAPNGSLDNYYSTYLKPFVDSTQETWKAKNLDGASFDLSNATLDFFKTIYEMQHLYFANHFSRLSIPFTLQPTDIDDTTMAVRVIIGSQQVVYENNTNKEFSSTQLTWPDEVSPNHVEIVFTDPQGRKVVLNRRDAWGLLKLLQKANFHELSPSQWSATFDRNGHVMIATLTFNSAHNPLSLNYFKHLIFPQEIQ